VGEVPSNTTVVKLNIYYYNSGWNTSSSHYKPNTLFCW